MMRNTTQCSIRAERIDFRPFHLSPNLRILYVLEGSLALRFTCGEHLLSAGEIEILNIDEPVQMKKLQENNLVLLFELDGLRAKQFHSDISRGIYNCNSTLFYTSKTLPVDQEILKRKLRLIYRYYLNDDSAFLIDKAMEDIVRFICDRCHDLKNMFPNGGGDELRGQRFLRVYTYMLENCDEKINLKKLAEQEFMSPQYLSKEFNERLGINFKDTLEYFRVIQAVRYLITGKMAVTEICQRCGFSALRYFYKHFAFYLNCTPPEFRVVYLTDPERVKSFPVNHSRIAAAFQTLDARDEPWKTQDCSHPEPEVRSRSSLEDRTCPEPNIGFNLEQALELALTQAGQARTFGSPRRCALLCIRETEQRDRLFHWMFETLSENSPWRKAETKAAEQTEVKNAIEEEERKKEVTEEEEQKRAEIVLVFCLEGFTEWSDETAAVLAHAAATAQQFCQTAEKEGLMTLETICEECRREEIADFLELQEHMVPILLVAARRRA